MATWNSLKPISKVALALGFSSLLIFSSLEIGLRTLGRGVMAEQENHNEVLPEDAKALRIVTLGESTTADREHKGISWPRQLEKKLIERGVRARVYNLARRGTTTSGILDRLPEQIEWFHPHIVINMSGANDASKLLGAEDTWWNDLRVVKLFRWSLLSMRKLPKDFPPQNFCEGPMTDIILKELQSRDDAVRYVSLEKCVGSLNQEQKAQTFNFFANQMFKSEGPKKTRFIELTRFSLAAQFQSGLVLRRMLRALNKTGGKSECLELAKKYLEQNWEIEEGILNIFTSCTNLAEGREVLEKMSGGGVALIDVKKRTASNHREIHRLLASKKIVHIEMQYPNSSVEELKAYFTNEDVIFLENKKNFEKALESHDYEDLFSDSVGGNYGHTTDLGGELIAELAANAVAPLAVTWTKGQLSP